jgi:hypothetical protein
VKHKAVVADISGVSDHKPVVLDFSTKDVSPVEIKPVPPAVEAAPSVAEPKAKNGEIITLPGGMTFTEPKMEGFSEMPGWKPKASPSPVQ